MSSSGAPKKIEGMKSRNVWVMAMEVINTREVPKEISENKANVRRVAAMRLIWIPGVRPVRVPAVIPIARARISSNIKG